MKFEVTRITPSTVFVTTLTAEEFKKFDIFRCLTHSYAKYKPTGNDFMDAFIELVSRHLMCSCEIYGQQMGISARVLAKMLLPYSGMTFVQWRNAYVLLAACELLRDTDYTLAEIGVRLGFSGNNTFGRWFTKETDQTPALWRSRAKNRKEREERELLQELKALLHSGQLYKENGAWKLNATATDTDEKE